MKHFSDTGRSRPSLWGERPNSRQQPPKCPQNCFKCSLNLKYNYAYNYKHSGDEVNEDGLFVEFFASEFGPDEGEEDAKEKDDDGFGGVGGN